MKALIKVRGYRGVERADIELAPIALIAGMNGGGKTSIAQAVAAAWANSPIPFFNEAKPDKPSLLKTEAKQLVRAGMDTGTAEILVDGTVAAKVGWPGPAWESDGRVTCSRVAAQLIDPMKLSDAERQKFFSELLRAVPSAYAPEDNPKPSDLQLELMEKVPALGDEDDGKALRALLEQVEVSGFDAVHATAKEKGSRLKGQWEAAAGTAYGSKKGEAWRPEGWREPLTGTATPESIGTDLTRAEAALDAARANAAVDASEIARLEEAVKGEKAAYEAYKEAQDTVAAAKARADSAVAAVNSIHIPNAVPCPHCGAYVHVMKGENDAYVLEVADDVSDAVIEAAKDQADRAQGAAREAVAALKDHERVLAGARAAYEAVGGSQVRLDKARERKGSADAVAEAQDLVTGLRADKAMVGQVAEAQRLHRLITANQIIVDILSPEGLRRQKLVKALDKLNQQVFAPLCQDAGYLPVTLDADLEALYGGRKHFLLSASEQYRVRAILQLGIALNDGSSLVIYDGADILDPPGRNGLFKMLGATEDMNFLVCMTMASRDKVPDLKKAGLGASFWIEGNVAAPL